MKDRSKVFDKPVIITGVTGYIGRALAKYLLLSGVSVYGVGRNVEELAKLKQYGDFHPVVADFEDYDKLNSLIDERDFAHFYHLAWQGTNASDHNDYADYNVQVRNIKAACDAAINAVRLECDCSSAISSYQQADVAIYDGAGFNSVYYGIAKRCACDMFKAIAYKHGLPCVNLVIPNTYGPNDRLDTAIVHFIKALLQNDSLSLITGEYPDDWMYIDDLVDGIIAASKPLLKYTDYYVGHRNMTTFKEKLIEMKSVLNSSSELDWGKYPENYYVDYNHFDLDALYRDTGWEAKTGFPESILVTADWVKQMIARGDSDR